MFSMKASVISNDLINRLKNYNHICLLEVDINTDTHEITNREIKLKTELIDMEIPMPQLSPEQLIKNNDRPISPLISLSPTSLSPRTIPPLGQAIIAQLSPRTIKNNDKPISPLMSPQLSPRTIKNNDKQISPISLSSTSQPLLQSLPKATPTIKINKIETRNLKVVDFSNINNKNKIIIVKNFNDCVINEKYYNLCKEEIDTIKQQYFEFIKTLNNLNELSKYSNFIIILKDDNEVDKIDNIYKMFMSLSKESQNILKNKLNI